MTRRHESNNTMILYSTVARSLIRVLSSTTISDRRRSRHTRELLVPIINTDTLGPIISPPSPWATLGPYATPPLPLPLEYCPDMPLPGLLGAAACLEQDGLVVASIDHDSGPFRQVLAHRDWKTNVGVPKMVRVDASYSPGRSRWRHRSLFRVGPLQDLYLEDDTGVAPFERVRLRPLRRLGRGCGSSLGRDRYPGRADIEQGPALDRQQLRVVLRAVF